MYKELGYKVFDNTTQEAISFEDRFELEGYLRAAILVYKLLFAYFLLPLTFLSHTLYSDLLNNGILAKPHLINWNSTANWCGVLEVLSLLNKRRSNYDNGIQQT